MVWNQTMLGNINKGTMLLLLLATSSSPLSNKNSLHFVLPCPENANNSWMLRKRNMLIVNATEEITP